jgi:thiol-disulfide isomerase/thioredoxin
MRCLFMCLLLVFAAHIAALDKAPDFSAADFDGNNVQLSELLKNGAVILDFWASWCVPCKKELPELAKLGEKYDSLTVVAVTIDKPKDRPKAKAAAKAIKCDIVYLFDQDDQVKNLLEVQDVPTTFIIDRNGKILFRHTGYNNGEESVIDEALAKFLKPAPTTGDETK